MFQDWKNASLVSFLYLYFARRLEARAIWHLRLEAFSGARWPGLYCLSRFALNSLPGFHSGYFSACATR